MDLSHNKFSNEIMKHLAKMLKGSAISCTIQTGNGIMKYSLDENNNAIYDGAATSAEATKRHTCTTKRTSWEATDERENMLFDDKSLKLCMRISSPFDKLDDLYYATIKPTLSTFMLTTGETDMQISIRDKEIIAAVCYASCQSLVEMLKQKEQELNDFCEQIKHYEKAIAQLKRENDVPQQKTRQLVDAKLAEISRQTGKNFTLSKDAEKFVNDFAGNDITLLLDAICRTANLKTVIHDNSQIVIDDTDIIIKEKIESEMAVSATSNINGVIDKRHAKIIQYLEKLEDAFNSIVAKGAKPTAINIAEEMRVTSASITMWFNKHSEDSKRLCDADANLCKNSRLQFDPLKEAIAGKRNKANRA